MSDEESKLVFKNSEIEVFSKYEKEFAKIFILEISVSAFNIYINY